MPKKSTGNQLLDMLPAKDLKRIAPHLRTVTLDVREPLNTCGAAIDQIFFPIEAMVSLVATLDDRTQVEIGVVGAEGMVGATVLLGSSSASNDAFVQIAGSALRIRTSIFLNQVQKSAVLRERLLLFTQTLLVQIAQTAACNARHTVVQRLSRWLLMAQDRAGSRDLPLTQEFLSIMLGVRRAGITVAARSLQSANSIEYDRGRITVLSRRTLEVQACECYRITMREYARLMNGPRQRRQGRH